MTENHEGSSSASGGPAAAARPQEDASVRDAATTFKKNLIRVMAVQVVTLLLLGYLQYLFTP